MTGLVTVIHCSVIISVHSQEDVLGFVIRVSVAGVVQGTDPLNRGSHCALAV